MYKLVVIAGKLRGEEYELEPGENTLGRDESCTIHFPVAGVSKQHLSVTVTDDVAYIQDLGSSNGTFLNGKIIKRGTVQNGDKIALPDSILQVVWVEEKKVIIHKKIEVEEDDTEEYITGGAIPDSPVAKIFYYFKYKVMPLFHGINEEYEWRILLGILLAIFVIINATSTILPILADSKKLLLHETAKRGAHYAEEIGRINARALEQNNLDRVNTNFMDKEDDVYSYALFDMEGRIVRPLARLNDWISDPFSVQVKDWANKIKDSDGKKVYKKRLEGDMIGIGKKIMAYSTETNDYEPVGVIAIRFAPRSLAVEATKSSKAYLEALVTSFITSIIFFGIIYYLTIRHLEEMRFQIEDTLRGKRRNLESRYLMEETDKLRDSINSVIQRNRELLNEEVDSEFEEAESDDTYTNMLGEFMRGASGGVMVLDSAKNVCFINSEAEDVTGIRESSSQGLSILDVSREKGFSGTIIDICDNCANNQGTNQSAEYELQGNNYEIHCAGIISKEGFTKAFYITFKRD
jgi:pSer/pThr/pTyr-binding forkhead associated (FHA) protein